MGPSEAGFLGIVVLLILLLLRMQIGIVMGLVGFVGYCQYNRVGTSFWPSRDSTLYHLCQQ